ncbi:MULTISPECIES: conjugal transfer nickase/helicase domain-containing protein [Gammaproteobacteria]|uniref:conjugal transfer nickase/helicase domain-containing protein n=1 Tax=Gammaproteobacteria TaxID=1236 RepID=UPI003369FF6A
MLVQRHFERLHVHRRQASGPSLWACKVGGPRNMRSLQDCLLSDHALMFAKPAWAMLI